MYRDVFTSFHLKSVFQPHVPSIHFSKFHQSILRSANVEIFKDLCLTPSNSSECTWLTGDACGVWSIANTTTTQFLNFFKRSLAAVCFFCLRYAFLRSAPITTFLQMTGLGL